MCKCYALIIEVAEKNFISGHKYAPILYDVDRGCVFDVVQGRDEKSVTKLFDFSP